MGTFFALLAARIFTLATGIGGRIVTMISLIGLSYIAIKGLLFFLTCVVFPLVMFNFNIFLMQKALEVCFSLIYEYIPQGMPVVQITGMAGYIAQEIYLLQSLSIIFAAVSARFAISFVPGLR